MKKTLIGWLLDNKDVAYPGIYKPEGDGWIPCTITYSEDEWEEVEVVRWECKRCKAIQRDTFVGTCPSLGCACEDFIELKGVDRRRKPDPEVWEGTTKRSVSGNVAIIQLSSEWIDKRVRVEVVE